MFFFYSLITLIYLLYCFTNNVFMLPIKTFISFFHMTQYPWFFPSIGFAYDNMNHYWFGVFLLIIHSTRNCWLFDFLQLFRMLLGINVRVLLILLLLGLGAIFYVGARTSPIIVFVFSVCILSFLVAIYLTKWVLAKDEGPPEMVQVILLPFVWLI